MRRFLVLSALGATLCGGMIAPTLFRSLYSIEMSKVAALAATSASIVPSDIVRVLALLMAVRYLLELPDVIRHTRAHLQGATNFIDRLFIGLQLAISAAIKIAVPVTFYGVFGGGEHNIYAFVGKTTIV